MNHPSPEKRLNSFEEFWPYYVREHSHPANRLLHFVGSTLVLVCVVSAFITGNLWLVSLSFIPGYGFAWFGHFFIEMNKPASFKYPLWQISALVILLRLEDVGADADLANGAGSSSLSQTSLNKIYYPICRTLCRPAIPKGLSRW